MAKQVKKEYQNKEVKDETFDMESFLTDNNEEKVDTKVKSEKIKETEVDEEKEQLKKEIAESQNTIKQLQEQMTSLMKMVADKNGNNIAMNEDDELVEVGCRCFAGLGMTNADGTQNILFRCGERKAITVSDLKSYLKENIRNNKALFSNGLLFFYDENNYDRFRVRKSVDLSEKRVIEIITMADTNEMIRNIAEMTNDLRREGVVYTLKYMIADMIIRKVESLKEFSYYNRDELEKYFGVKFDTLIRNAQMYKFYKGEE